MADTEIKIVILADTSGAEAAFSQVSEAARQLCSSSTSSLDSAYQAVGSSSTQAAATQRELITALSGVDLEAGKLTGIPGQAGDTLIRTIGGTDIGIAQKLSDSAAEGVARTAELEKAEQDYKNGLIDVARQHQELQVQLAHLFEPLIEGFETAVVSVLRGTEKIGQAFAKLGISIAIDLAKTGLDATLLSVPEKSLWARIFGVQGKEGGLLGLGASALGLGALVSGDQKSTAGQGSTGASDLAGAVSGATGSSATFEAMQNGLKSTLSMMLSDAATFGGKILKALDFVPGFSAVVSRLGSLFGSLAGPATSALTAQKAIDLETVQEKAATAAASQFSWVIQTVPFPGNLALAPDMAAAAYLATIGAGAFEAGGLVPRDMMALVHSGEIVVPTRFSDLLRSGDFSLGNGEVHLHYAPVLHVGEGREAARTLSSDVERVFDMVREGVRAGRHLRGRY